MQVVPIGDILLIELVDVDLLLAMGRLEEVDKIAHELPAVLVDVLLGIFADQQHLPNVALALDMAVVAIESVYAGSACN